MVTDSTSAFLFVVGIWNKIAELTGDLVQRYGERLSERLEEFSSPPVTAYFWTPSLIRWLRDQTEAFSEASKIVAEGISEWGQGVRKIVSSAASGELPLPKKLGQRVIKTDDAWRMAIRLLLSTADTVSQSDRAENERIILEVAAPSRSSSVDDDPEETTLQRAWKGVVKIAVAFASATLPFAIAWVAAISYLRLWSEDRVPLEQSLPQDSQRVSGVSIRRTRKNKKKGPDR